MKAEPPASIREGKPSAIRSLSVVHQTIVRGGERPETRGKASLNQHSPRAALNVEDSIFDFSIAFVNAGDTRLLKNSVVFTGIKDLRRSIGIDLSNVVSVRRKRDVVWSPWRRVS